LLNLDSRLTSVRTISLTLTNLPTVNITLFIHSRSNGLDGQ